MTRVKIIPSGENSFNLELWKYGMKGYELVTTMHFNSDEARLHVTIPDSNVRATTINLDTGLSGESVESFMLTLEAVKEKKT